MNNVWIYLVLSDSASSDFVYYFPKEVLNLFRSTFNFAQIIWDPLKYGVSDVLVHCFNPSHHFGYNLRSLISDVSKWYITPLDVAIFEILDNYLMLCLHGLVPIFVLFLCLGVVQIFVDWLHNVIDCWKHVNIVRVVEFSILKLVQVHFLNKAVEADVGIIGHSRWSKGLLVLEIALLSLRLEKMRSYILRHG